jgi:hypothetical protein
MSRRRAAVAAAWLCASLLVGSCVTAQVGPAVEGPSRPSAGASAPAPGQTSTPAADPLCRPVPPSPLPAPTETSAALPPAIAAILPQLEAVRGLRFLRAVTPRPVTQPEMASIIADSVDQSLPADRALATEQAWTTIGVLPPGTDLRAAYRELNASQVIGVYDQESGSLYFVGSDDPSPLERFTLAHELTHALDDQHFDLSRLDAFNARCEDDQADAYTALAEGDAMEGALQWARDNMSVGDITELAAEAAAAPQPPASTPPFLLDLLEFPYSQGQSFVEALLNRGGEGAVDDAFTDPPASTEQILHPDRYPTDPPVAVEVPRIAPQLGEGWKDLEVQDVGEEWLRLMLALRLDDGTAERAADGWDGGQYRAFADGDRVAVLMDTAWDSPSDASEFAQAMQSWVGDASAAVERDGDQVRVLFGSDADALAALRSAA